MDDFPIGKSLYLDLKCHVWRRTRYRQILMFECNKKYCSVGPCVFFVCKQFTSSYKFPFSFIWMSGVEMMVCTGIRCRVSHFPSDLQSLSRNREALLEKKNDRTASYCMVFPILLQRYCSHTPKILVSILGLTFWYHLKNISKMEKMGGLREGCRFADCRIDSWITTQTT